MEFWLMFLVWVAVVGLITLGAIELVVWIVKAVRNRPAVRRARIEAELDRQQAELRSAILTLAAQLGADAHEARKALIRESFLASRRVPPK